MATYIAYPCGKMNQSFAMKDEAKDLVIYEAKLTKFRLFGASDFDFVDNVASKTQQHKVGKTKTTEMGAGNVSFATSSYFNLDDENVFDVLEEKGYRLRILAKIDVMHPEFEMIDKSGNRVATYKLNVLGDRQPNVAAIGNKQRNTVVTTTSEDLEAVFLGAFIFSHVDFSAYLV